MSYPRGWALGAFKLGMPQKEYAHHRIAGEHWCSEGRHWAPKDRFKTRTNGSVRNECEACRSARSEAFKAAYLAEHGVPYVRKTGDGSALQESA
jgi:hypothetical protein